MSWARLTKARVNYTGCLKWSTLPLGTHQHARSKQEDNQSKGVDRLTHMVDLSLWKVEAKG